MKYLTGFFMTWGNFCSLPCPVKRWDNNCKSLMLGFLPTIGLVIGLIWAAIYVGLVYLGFPFLVVSFILAFLPFALCGFMHMDGFMDCSDAIMSRRPLEDRQRILKDTHTGAFAVISAIFMILGYFAFVSTAASMGMDFVNIVIITVLSRSVSGLEVLLSKPLGTSQYVALSDGVASEANDDEADEAYETEKTEQKPVAATKRQGLVLLLIHLVIYSALGFWASSFYASTALVYGAVVLGTFISITYAKKQLGGMSGDIAGYGIVWGEFCGVAMLVFC
ncbi:MAG: adenosylcobinamide-GDP ribazoletransferase [Firmicutes bacterium]|nr:adenosylcobinamide-GDP ribazoletransferase [Bacillota bacterium]